MSGAPEPPDDSGNRLSGWLKSKAATLEEHVKEMRENTKQIAQDVAGGLKAAAKSQRQNEEQFDVTFVTKALGLELDLQAGAIVRVIKPGGQAESLQVCAQDRLVAIAGEPLPPIDDPEFVDTMRRRMSSMSRPVTVTFSRIVDAPTATSEQQPQPAEDAENKAAARPRMPNFARPVFARSDETAASAAEASSATVELAAAREQVQRLEAELAQAKAEVNSAKKDAKNASDDAVAAVEEAHALRADLADFQLSKVWSAQEVSRSQAEAEVATSQAADAHAAMSRAQADTESAEQARQVAEQVLATARQETEEQRAQVSQLRLRHEVAEATSEQFRRLINELQQREELARKEAESRQAALEEQSIQSSGAKQLYEATTAELDALKVSHQSAEETVQRLSSELESLRVELRGREANAVVADKIIAELKREVEKLCTEVRRHEAANPTGADHRLGFAGNFLGEDDPHEQIAALKGEVDYLRETLQQREDRLEASVKNVSALRVEVDRLRSSEGAHPAATVVGKAGGELDWVDCSSADAFDPERHSEDALSRAVSELERCHELEAQIHELQAQKGGLERQLNSRPIVYQFGPTVDDEDEQCRLLEEEDNATTNIGDNIQERSGMRVITNSAALWCRRRAARACVKCRKLKLARNVERLFRNFTRALLRSPLLMWMFYVHLLALWFIEFWRQAVDRHVEGDNYKHFEHVVAQHAAGKPL